MPELCLHPCCKPFYFRTERTYYRPSDRPAGGSDSQCASVTIVCDGYCRGEHQKPAAERNWDHVAQKLDGVDRTALSIKFDLLEAASIRTCIMLLAEWQHLVDEAVTLATNSLECFPSDDCRFLILEVTGRQWNTLANVTMRPHGFLGHCSVMPTRRASGAEMF